MASTDINNRTETITPELNIMKRFFPFKLLLLAAGFSTLLSTCQVNSDDTIDLLLINGNLVTIDEQKPSAQAIAIDEGRILKVGTNQELEPFRNKAKKVLDLNNQFAMPGFIEGHGHFSGLGESLINLNFLQSKNWEEIVNQVADKVKKVKPGEWIEGRGWHQEKWDTAPEQQIHGYPYHDALSAISPENPVVLRHASGHSLFANKKAMEAAGVSLETPDPDGGEIVRTSNGEAIGVFEERAMKIILNAYDEYLENIPELEKKAKWMESIELAQQECLSKGITSFQDAGSTFEEIEQYHEMAKAGQLDLRLWAMIRHSYADMKDRLDPFPIIDAGNHFFTAKAIKSEVDGALGAFGAWLLAAYHDKPHFVGQNTTPLTEVADIARLADHHDLQLCVHAIGDRANRVVLDMYEHIFQQNPKADRRWRIEHAQHLDPDDIPRFKKLGIIASIQGIHCTSDAPFVEKRLGTTRARVGAYPWRSLLDNGVILANGTDAPVEDVSALQCIYASVTRKRADTGLEFFPEQRMSRQEALYSYTLGNAYAGFEEAQKGSLTEGKLADIVVLSHDLLNCTDEEILQTQVQYTIVGGQIKYQAP
ncbi:MAG: amidohydrolase [Bacteroidota bacterium]